MSQVLRIQGGTRLNGAVSIGGAKNAVLPAIAAALLTEDEVLLENVPQIDDIAIMAQVLRSLGVDVAEQPGRRLLLCARNVTSVVAPPELVKRNRASFLVMGPLLARFGEACSPPPGGDVIGQRPIDVHLAGFAALGAEISQDGECYRARAPRLRGSYIFMDYPSHIGTENLLMAAVLAEGKTIIKHASCEPEIVDLAQMLTHMGAQISGAGTSTIEVEGVSRLRGATHRVIPDRIEAGTYAIAAAITSGDVELSPVVPEHMDSLLWKLGQAGVGVERSAERLRIQGRSPLRAVNVQALPYPGFATDLQSAIGVLLTQAHGQSTILERVYDNRLRYFDELRKMGAQVDVDGQTAQVRGPARLRGARVKALDIRSGAALVLAGLVAEGITKVGDIEHLDRGYESIEKKLSALGAQIERRSGASGGTAPAGTGRG